MILTSEGMVPNRIKIFPSPEFAIGGTSGYDVSRLYSTTDSVNFNTVSSFTGGTGIGTSWGLFGIDYSNGVTVITTDGLTGFASIDDGKSWTTFSNPSTQATWRASAYLSSTNQYALVGTVGISGTIATSDGFRGWQQTIYSDNSKSLFGVAASDSTMIAVGNVVYTYGSRTLAYYFDPANRAWWIMSSSAFTHARWLDIAYSSKLNLFVAVGDQYDVSPTGRLAYGNTGGFTACTSTNANANFYSIAWSPSLEIFCAVGDVVKTSADGINWTQRSTSVYTSITWSSIQSKFFACNEGRNGISYSDDGITWYACTLSNTTDLIKAVGGGR